MAQVMFTGDEVWRLGASLEFTASLAIIYGLGRVLGAARPTTQFGVPIGPQRPLTVPLYDLLAQGGDMRINNRWYSEHTLERMSPDTPQVRAQLRTRVEAEIAKPGSTSFRVITEEEDKWLSQ
ncbi:hypothetical protein [Neobacillus vireti]|uniref:hypothetical protein n=1 Tax=Neobacillus vireti TaxID=220686 RepID=UPI0030006070